jgi:ribosomal protein S18 acetylase RimI-like enzyme
MDMNIAVATIRQLSAVKRLYTAVTGHLRRSGISQWDRFYPNRWVIGQDLKRGQLFAVLQGDTCVGAVVVNERQNTQYAGLAWRDQTGKPAVIHRLAVHPEFQGQGIGKRLLHYAEELARAQGSTSIRLDAYTANPTAIRMYERAGYTTVGCIRYPLRKHPYECFEKLL